MGLKADLKYWIRQFPFIYPSKIIFSCEDWVNKQRKKKGIYLGERGPWYKVVFPEGFIINQDPKTLGPPNQKAFFINKAYTTRKATLFYLQNSYLFGHKGMVLTKNQEIFQEFSHHFGISTFRKFLLKNPFYTFTKAAKKIQGIGAVLVSPESHNYYHWLNDVLPRIRLYEDALNQIDHFCISSAVPAKFLEILNDFGVLEAKILFIEEKEKLYFEHLYVSSLPGSEGRSPKWAIDYIRGKLLKNNTIPKAVARKIYLQRGNVNERKVLNGENVINFLKNNGFEIIEPDGFTLYEQVGLMQQVSTIIAAHGAALSNLLFAGEATKVIEIFSPDYFRTDCYYTLSSMLNLDYWYIVGDKPAGAAWGDIEISLDILEKTIYNTGTYKNLNVN